MYSYLTAHSTYFHQGFDLFEEDDNFMKEVAGKVSAILLHNVFEIYMAILFFSVLQYSITVYHKSHCHTIQ